MTRRDSAALGPVCTSHAISLRYYIGDAVCHSKSSNDATRVSVHDPATKDITLPCRTISPMQNRNDIVSFEYTVLYISNRDLTHDHVTVLLKIWNYQIVQQHRCMIATTSCRLRELNLKLSNSETPVRNRGDVASLVSIGLYIFKSSPLRSPLYCIHCYTDNTLPLMDTVIYRKAQIRQTKYFDFSGTPTPKSPS